jgi:hypothetical protein
MADPAPGKMSLGFSPLMRVLGAGITIMTGCLILFLPVEELVKGMLGIFLGVFVLGGLVVALWSRGLVADERAGTLILWSGILVPLVRQHYSLASITHVRLSKRIIQTGKGPRVLYPVFLARQKGDGIELWETMDYARSRRHAEKLAKVVRRDLHDDSTGETMVREWKYLDEPLAQRFRRLRLAAPAPAPRENAVARVRRAGGAVVVEIPGTGFRASYLGLALFCLFPGVLLVGLFSLSALRQGGITPAFLVVGGILLAATLLPAVVTVLHFSTQREVITASGSGIEVEAGSWVRRKRIRLPAVEIEEILAPADVRRAAGTQGEFMRALAYSAGGRSIVIRTDKGDTGVGRWISGDEQLWLKDVLVHALVTGGDRPIR